MGLDLQAAIAWTSHVFGAELVAWTTWGAR